MRGLLRSIPTRFISCALSLALVLGPALSYVRPAYAAEASPESPVGTQSADTSPTVVRELTEKRTSTATHYLMSDGTMRAELSPVPVRFRDDAGAWQTIDPSLIPGTEPGSVQTAETSMTAVFGSQGPSGPPVTLSGGGYSVGIDMLGATEAGKIVLGDTVRYLDVATDADLEYEATRGGIKETILVSGPDAPSTYRFSMRLQGLELKKDALGKLALYHPGKAVPVLRIGDLVVFDSSTDASAVCPDASMSVESVAGDTAIIRYDIDDTWMNDPSRVFPIHIDPTIQGQAQTGDNFVYSRYPTNDYSQYEWLYAGVYTTGGTTYHAEAYVAFDFDAAGIEPDTYVQSATFSAYQYNVIGTGTKVKWGYLSEESTGGTRWATKPDITQVGTGTVGSDGWMDVSCTGTVQNWLDGDQANYGFGLTEADSTTLHYFRSSDYTGGSTYLPKLVIAYSHPSVTGTGVDKAVYSIGETVTATVRVNSGLPADINCIQACVNYAADDDTSADRRGTFQWTKTSPSGWNQSTQLSGGAGGWVSSNDSAQGSSTVTFLPGSCSATSDSAGMTATFKWKLNSDYGDIQNNDIDVIIKMDPVDSNNNGNIWTSDTQIVDTDFDVAPSPITTLNLTKSPSARWFKEVDRNGDGLSDTPNDKPDMGRGSVNLTWTPSPLADGYNVYLYDGYTDRKVAQLPGNSATSWSSEGAGIFPKDSDYATRAADSWTANPFTGASTLAPASRTATITVGDGGTGVVVSDGGHLYYRAWTTYPGPDTWKRIGTGLNGTDASTATSVGPDFSARPIQSAFLLDGVIYNGYALTPTTVEGVPVSAVDGAAQTRTLTFTRPLLERTTGDSLTVASANVMLAATDERIYSVSYNLTSGDAKDGFRIREYDRDGTFVADHDIACDSFCTDGLIADGTNLRFIQWGSTPSRVVKVSTSSWKVTDSSVSGFDASREINGCYDPANNVFWMGAVDAGYIRRYPGPGLDLRDDPNGLYLKTQGETYDSLHQYRFTVAPYSEVAQPASTGQWPTLDNRTVRVNDDPRHTTYELGVMEGHEAQASLDRGSLELDVTDLEIASWGPRAALTRHYSSASTSAVVFAPGWTFDFESRIATTSATITDYYDETGERHRFTKDVTSGVWVSPNGAYDALVLANGVWTLTRKDRSVVTFGADGKIASEADANGNVVTYLWTANKTHLSIQAANTQSIEATFTSGGLICTAEYATPEGPRTVEFNYGDGYHSDSDWQIARYFGETDENRVAIYDYTPTTHERLEAISEPRFTAAGPYGAYWSFYYNSQDKLNEVRWPGCDDFVLWPNSDDRRRSTVAYGSSSATVTVAGEVEQCFTWNPTGTEAWHSNRRAVGTNGLEKWVSTYDPQNELASNTSPLGVMTRTNYDSRGNAIYEFDGKGGMTSNVYDAYDQLVRTTSPAGRTTYSSYDAMGDLASEERVLSAGGERSRNEYSYDSCGRTTVERRRISENPGAWAETEYGNFAPNGEPQTITQKAVKLSDAASPVDLVSTKSFDSDGKLLWEKNAKDEYVSYDNHYDITGALLASTDASGVVTHRAYDKLGFESETSRTAGSVWADWKRTACIPNGQVYEESYMGLVDGTPTVLRTDQHTVDAIGNETAVETPDGTTALSYDAQGQVISQTVPGVADPAEAEYDEEGQLIAETAPGDAVEATYGYDDNGELVIENPTDEATSTFVYDADGNQIAAGEPLEGSKTATSTSEYDTAGRLIRSLDEKGFATTFAYDQLDNQLTATSGGAVSSTTYNTLGWVLSETDPDGQTTTHGYDAAGRVTAESVAGKVTNKSHDATGRELTRILPDGTQITFGYDALGRLEAETHTRAGETLRAWTHTYDTLGHGIATTESGSGVVTSLDFLGDSVSGVSRRSGSLTTTITMEPASEQSLSARLATASPAMTRSVIGKDDAGRAIAYTLNAGASLASTRSYSGAGQLEGQGGAGLGANGLRYDYSAVTGREGTETVDLAYPGGLADHTRTFTYDDAGRLTTATDIGVGSCTFAYTADGKIIKSGSRTFTYDSDGRLATMASSGATTTYEYDSRGRRSKCISPTEAIVYSYDDADHLTGFTRDAGKDNSIEASAAYSYDGNGQRTRSVVTSGSTTTTTTSTYDGLTLLAAASVCGTRTTSVAYVNDSANRPVAAYVSLPETSTPQFVWMVTNQRGDVLELLGSDGSALAHYAYSPYGELLSTEARAVGATIPASIALGIRDAVELRFAGYTWDDESGLYYCSQRYYDPVTCQWMTKDPARADGEESACQYCGGDPVGKVDPSGLWRYDVHFGLTYIWASSIVPVHALAIAQADESSDARSSFYYHSGASKAKYHGWQDATQAKKSLLSKGALYWTCDRARGVEYLGHALHTLQDIYAHRRGHWTTSDGADRWKNRFTWLDYSEYRVDNRKAARHQAAHDNWDKATPYVKMTVEGKTKECLWEFLAGVGG